MAIDKALLDQLLAGREPQDLFAKGGLIDDLKKALSERMLAAELDDHLETEAEAGLGNRRNGSSKKTMLTGSSKLTLDTNTVEREIRPVAVTRKAALFAGSEGGGENWAIGATLIRTAILNGVDPQAWLTDVLEQMVSGKVNSRSLAALLPWAWRDAKRIALAA